MVKDICKDAGIEGKKTNHSLRVTEASKLFAVGVPEKINTAAHWKVEVFLFSNRGQFADVQVQDVYKAPDTKHQLAQGQFGNEQIQDVYMDLLTAVGVANTGTALFSTFNSLAPSSSPVLSVYTKLFSCGSLRCLYPECPCTCS